MADRRFGRFSISLRDIEDEPSAVRAIMGEVIVLRAEAKFASHAIEYEALCEQFDPVEAGAEMPSYDVIFEADAYKVSFVKQD